MVAVGIRRADAAVYGTILGDLIALADPIAATAAIVLALASCSNMISRSPLSHRRSRRKRCPRPAGLHRPGGSAMDYDSLGRDLCRPEDTEFWCDRCHTGFDDPSAKAVG